MKMIGKELQERNRYIETLNKAEATINSCLCNLQINLINPATIVKGKLHEMKDLFYQQEIKFYENFALGLTIREFLLSYLQDTIGYHLRKIISFEEKITIKNVRLPIQNPFVKNFNKRIEEIKSFNIDEKLPERLGKHMEIENLNSILFIDDDLIKLGYPNLAEKAVERTLEEMNKRKVFIKK